MQMKIFELKTKLEELMRDSGDGDRNILFLDTDSGEVYELQDVVYDPAAECVFVMGMLSE